MTAAGNLYDSHPYPRLSYVHTTPDRMATVATLLGLEAPPIERCRVLEVGSAIGGNLIPMAMRMPDSTFLGIDLSANQTRAAQAQVERLGLQNISFLERDLAQFDDDLEPFDFIIAHGIYSWVPPAARQALLELCAARLSEHGMANISYNTFPGWYGLLAIRRIMQDAARGIEDPEEQARAGADAVKFFRDVWPDNHPLGTFLRWYINLEEARLEVNDRATSTLVLHDELSEYNDPVYLGEFVAAAEKAGLSYVADADLPASFPNGVPDDVVAAISKRVRSAVEFEQHLDMLRNTTFRRSLLVRGKVEVQRRLRPDPAMMMQFSVRSRAVPEGSVEINDRAAAAFAIPAGARLTTDHPLSKAAMLELRAANPQSLSFRELAVRAWGRVEGHGQSAPPADQLTLLGANLLRGYTYNIDLIDLRLGLPNIAGSVTERPLVDEYTRTLALEGERVVSNRYHERVQLAPVQAFILSLLDGTRDHTALAHELEATMQAKPGSEQPDAGAIVSECLEFYAETGLFAG